MQLYQGGARVGSGLVADGDDPKRRLTIQEHDSGAALFLERSDGAAERRTQGG